ncbi:MAG: AMP-binding protein, partial [bacterium]
MNTAVYLERAGRTFGERTAVAVGDKRHSDFAELAGRVAAIAGGLRDRLGLVPGDRLALAMKNCPEFIEILYAAWHAGLCAVPVNAKLHPREIAYILDHSGARCCIVTPDLMEAVAPLAEEVPGLERVISVGTGEHRSLLAGDPAPLVARGPDEVAWLFYTSGTTGRPKGAMLSHRCLQAMTLSYFADVDAVSGGDCILHAAPMSHGSGLYILPHMAMAAKQVIPESGGFDPEEIFRLLPAHEGMTLFAAPTMVTRLVHSPGLGAADLRNLKTIVYGGGPMYVEDLRLAMERIGNKLVQAYGQGE